MYEEQRMMASGVPFSEASGIRRSLRREATMGRPDEQGHPLHHTCKCGGAGNCPDCPNKNR